MNEMNITVSMNKMTMNMKYWQCSEITPDVPKNERGLTQMITMRKSIHQIWVKVSVSFSRLLLKQESTTILLSHCSPFLKY